MNPQAKNIAICDQFPWVLFHPQAPYPLKLYDSKIPVAFSTDHNCLGDHSQYGMCIRTVDMPSPRYFWGEIVKFTLLETNVAPENRPKPNRKGSYSNHPFSGAFAVSLREGRPW